MQITDAKEQALLAEYKKNYAPFRPFVLSDQQKMSIGTRYASLLVTQDGQDTDDYYVEPSNKVQKYLSTFVDKRCLLLGVGTGREVLEARNIGINAEGITLGSRNIDFAEKHLELKGLVSEAVVETLDYDKETFDVVAGFQIFEHAISPLLFLLELGRILKTGGTLLLEWPPASQYTMGENPHHQICYTPGQAEALFLKAGFRDIKLHYDDGEMIPQTDFWCGEQNRMLVIQGVKVPTRQEYIKKAWGL